MQEVGESGNPVPGGEHVSDGEYVSDAQGSP